MYLDLTDSVTKLIQGSVFLSENAQAVLAGKESLDEAAESLKTWAIGQADLRRLKPFQAVVYQALLEEAVYWDTVARSLGYQSGEDDEDIHF